MEDDTELETSSAPRDDDLARIQYEQTVTHLAFLQGLFWKIPSAAVSINTGVLVLSFEFVDDIVVRPFLLLIAVVLTASLAMVLETIRHFSYIQVGTLHEIESRLGNPHVQRSTTPIADNTTGGGVGEYWYSTTPEKRAAKGIRPPYVRTLSVSSDWVLISGMWLSVAALFVLFLWQATALLLRTFPGPI